jgi:3',5'-cyclic AMP phosphodiesterase CpdA
MLLAVLAFLTGCQTTHFNTAAKPAVHLERVADEPEGRHFYFVQITDTHFGDRGHIERASIIVDRINHLPMDVKFVLHSGDITMNRTDDPVTVANGLAVLNELKVPIHYVPGNHDILPEKLETTTLAYTKEFGPLVTSLQYGAVTFILIYTEPLAQSFSLDGYEPLQQLESCLKKAGNSPVIICHHTPCVEDFYRNEMHEGWKREVRDKWEKLINSYNVKAVIAGHFHRDEQHWLGEVPLYVSPPVAGYWGRQATFRIYEYKNGKISYRTQYIR